MRYITAFRPTAIWIEHRSNGNLFLMVTVDHITLQRSAHKQIVVGKEPIEHSYPLREVSIDELLELRLSGEPGAVYKQPNGQYFYTTIDPTLNLSVKPDKLGKHACGLQCKQVCQNCPRTKDLTVAYQKRIGKKSFFDATINSWRIEKYDFIVEGLETFNMTNANDVFLVLDCKNYVPGHSINA